MEFSRPEYWSTLPFPSPGDLPNPGMEPRSPTLQANSLPAEPQGKHIPSLCPWDSPGKNTGVGCHFHLQCMKVKSERKVAQLYLTLRDPMDCSLPGSSVPEIF